MLHRFLLCVLLCVAAPVTGSAKTLRVGHFPNVTHVQGLVAHALSRQGKGWFEQRLGPDVTIDWYVFNAGPSAIEAIFARSIDITYVGPNPAINGFVKSNGQEIRVIAGALEGGSGLVVQPDLPLKTVADFKGKKIATPQFGNTQDVSARAWLVAGGLKVTQTGGDAQVLPTANPDQLALFKTKQIDAVWTVEPWISRLELEAGGKLLVDEPNVITTVLVTNVRLMETDRDLLHKFVLAQRELTDWIKAHPEEAQKLVQEELDAETHTHTPAELIAHAWPRIVLTDTISQQSIERFLASAQSVGFLRGTADLAHLIELP